MNDSQIVSIAITVLAILGATLVNNSRISDLQTRLNDLNGSLNRRIDDTRDVLRAEMQLGFASVNHRLDEILRILGDHETRITTIETKIR